jgi:hypothetical protein
MLKRHILLQASPCTSIEEAIVDAIETRSKVRKSTEVFLLFNDTLLKIEPLSTPIELNNEFWKIRRSYEDILYRKASH